MVDPVAPRAGSDTLLGGDGNDTLVGVYADFTAMMAVTHDESGRISPFGNPFTGTVIGTGADQIWLSSVTKAQLNAADFNFT